MLRKLILAVLMLCTLSAWADKRNKKAQSASSTVSSDTIDCKKPGSPLPPIRLVTAEKKVITNADLHHRGNLFVMLFNPTCEHCEDMTRTIEASISLFHHSQILLMAAPMMGPYLEYFDKTTHYTQFPSLITGIDSADFITKTFHYQMLPQINIYDKDQRLIRSFSGLSTIDSLKPYIQ